MHPTECWSRTIARRVLGQSQAQPYHLRPNRRPGHPGQTSGLRKGLDALLAGAPGGILLIRDEFLSAGPLHSGRPDRQPDSLARTRVHARPGTHPPCDGHGDGAWSGGGAHHFLSRARTREATPVRGHPPLDATIAVGPGSGGAHGGSGPRRGNLSREHSGPTSHQPPRPCRQRQPSRLLSVTTVAVHNSGGDVDELPVRRARSLAEHVERDRLVD